MANFTEFKNDLCKFVWNDVSLGKYEFPTRSDLNKIVTKLYAQKKEDLGMDLAITAGMVIEAFGNGKRFEAMLYQFNYHLTQADKILT